MKSQFVSHAHWICTLHIVSEHTTMHLTLLKCIYIYDADDDSQSQFHGHKQAANVMYTHRHLTTRARCGTGRSSRQRKITAKQRRVKPNITWKTWRQSRQMQLTSNNENKNRRKKNRFSSEMFVYILLSVFFLYVIVKLCTVQQVHRMDRRANSMRVRVCVVCVYERVKQKHTKWDLYTLHM